MSREQYNDSCPGCRPVLIDATTGQVFADDSPTMQAVKRAWNGTTVEERQAWHRVTCLNSRRIYDLNVVARFSERIKEELEKLPGGGMDDGTSKDVG
jgi:hypothetical protein